jgi:stage III sporulation protein AG
VVEEGGAAVNKVQKDAQEQDKAVQGAAEKPSWLGRLEEMAGRGPKGPNRVKMLRWLILVAAVGVALVIFGSFWTSAGTPTAEDVLVAAPGDGGSGGSGSSGGSSRNGGRTGDGLPDQAMLPTGMDFSDEFIDTERQYEERMEAILGKIVGVDNVDVMVVVESSTESVFARDEKNTQSVSDENDKNGGKRRTTSVTDDGVIVVNEVADDGALVERFNRSEIRGVIVVAKGVENQTVRQLVLDATAKGLGVPFTKISVVPSQHGIDSALNDRYDVVE